MPARSGLQFWPVRATALSASLLVACSSGDLDVGVRNVTLGVDAGAPAAARLTNRANSLPIGVEDVNNSPMSAATYRGLVRFVLDTTVTVDRLYFGFNVRGAACREPGTATDGGGDGGVIVARLTNIDATTGVPSTTLDSETVGACERYDEVLAVAGSTPGLIWLNLSATLEGGTMYGLVLENAAANPADDYFSFHMPIADVQLAGPQARNELDRNAAGAIMSLDPREHVAWSEDAGATWRYGVDNGQYPSFINDDDMGHPATHVPQYGLRTTDGVVHAPQPYYAYNSDCQGCTTLYANARYARRFTELGGFTASGTDVGTLTMRNEDSGAESSCTPAQGYGFRTCTLADPVDVAVGESYSVTSTGEVEVMRMDAGQRALFPSVGTAEDPLSFSQPNPGAGTNGKDVPSLWAGPVSANFPDADDI